MTVDNLQIKRQEMKKISFLASLLDEHVTPRILAVEVKRGFH